MSSEEVAEEVIEAMSGAYYTYALYGWDDWIRINPFLDKVHVARTGSGIWSCIELNIRLPSSADVSAGDLDELVTEPPCQQVTMSRLFWVKTEDTWALSLEPMICTVGRVEGVRIRYVRVTIIVENVSSDKLQVGTVGPHQGLAAKMVSGDFFKES